MVALVVGVGAVAWRVRFWREGKKDCETTSFLSVSNLPPTDDSVRSVLARIESKDNARLT